MEKNQKPQRIAILGAGISGLSMGWYLKQNFGDAISLVIYEKNARAGGWISTDHSTGFVFEEGPRSCRSRDAGAATLDLIESLGLSSEVIVASPAAKKRFVYHQGKLCAMPGLLGLPFSPLTRGVISALWHEWRLAPAVVDDESIYDFISRRFNADVAERLADPMTSGIYAGDIRRLSMQACFPKVARWEQEHGSVVGGMLAAKANGEPLSPFVKEVQRRGAIFSLKHGMESLVTALASRLEGQLQLNTAVNAIEVQGEKILLTGADGKIESFDRVFCALPAHEVSRLFKPLLKETYEVPTVSVVIVGMGWKSPVLQREGFGYLVPSREKQDVLGVVFDSSVFPQQNRLRGETRLTAMLGGAHRPEMATWSKEKIAASALRAITAHLGIQQAPDVLHIKVAKAAIPQYRVGHLAQVAKLKAAIAAWSPHVTLLGSSWHGVSVNDCIAEAKSKAKG